MKLHLATFALLFAAPTAYGDRYFYYEYGERPGYYRSDPREEYLADEADRLRDELEEERWRRDRGIELSPEEERRRAEYLADQAARLAEAHRREERQYGVRRYPSRRNQSPSQLPSPAWAHPGTNPSWGR